MDDYIKRINLSFDMRNEHAKHAYEEIIKQQGNTKTMFVIAAVNSISTVSEVLDKQAIMECLRQVLIESNFELKKSKTKLRIEEKIPDDIMCFLVNI